MRERDSEVVDVELARALLARALRDVDVVREEGGSNRGPVINSYLALVHEAPGSNWCAAAVCAWMRDACDALGRERPRFYSGAKLMGHELARHGWLFVPLASMSPNTAPPGSCVVFDRSRPDDPATPENEHAVTRWQGHIGLIADWESSRAFRCVEGNSGSATDRVALMLRGLSGPPRILGAYVPMRERAAA